LGTNGVGNTAGSGYGINTSSRVTYRFFGGFQKNLTIFYVF